MGKVTKICSSSFLMINQLILPRSLRSQKKNPYPEQPPCAIMLAWIWWMQMLNSKHMFYIGKIQLRLFALNNFGKLMDETIHNSQYRLKLSKQKNKASCQIDKHNRILKIKHNFMNLNNLLKNTKRNTLSTQQDNNLKPNMNHLLVVSKIYSQT